MQKFRQVYGWTGKDVARAFGCSASHISRVEQGKNSPSRNLVQLYEETFEADGLLLSLFETVVHAGEQTRQRAQRSGRRIARAIPGDASDFLDDTIPHGKALAAGVFFTKTWRVRNAGTVAWVGRQIERQGPLTGPGLISSARHYAVPDTKPGTTATIEALLKAPTYACSSIAYFKMVDADGALCFPERHQIGLDVLVRVAR